MISLAEVRPFLSKRPAEWVEAVLAGESNTDFAKRNGLTGATVLVLARIVAEAAGLEITGTRQAPIREAILRMRIAELEGAHGR